MSIPMTSIVCVNCTVKVAASRGGKTYLRVQEIPGANLLTGFFPAQDADELERKKYEVRGERGEYRSSGIHDMVNLTNISSPTPARYGRI
jgi:hypothetical protein